MIIESEFIKTDLVEKISDDDVNLIVEYIEKTFDDTPNSNNQMSNMVKLSNFLNKNSLFIEELECEKLLNRSKKLSNTLHALYLAGILVRINNYSNLITLFQIYCAENNVEQTRDVDVDLYEHSYESKDLDLFRVYLAEVGEFKLLSAEEEKILASQGEKGSNKLVEHNLRLVISIANTLKGLGVSLSDLIQYGNEGLIIAARKFDVNKGCRFSTYATWWIKQNMKRGIADASRTIRIPVHLHENIIKVKKSIAIYTMEHNGEFPSDEKISEMSGIPVDKVVIARNNMDLTVSLSTPIGGSGDEVNDTFLGDMIEDTNSSLENNAHKLYLEEFFEAFELSGYITPKEKEILKYRFGFYDGKEYTLEEVGQMFGVTRERIRQIQKKALTKVRRDIYLRRFDPKKIDKEYDLRLKRKSKGSSNLKMVL